MSKLPETRTATSHPTRYEAFAAPGVLIEQPAANRAGAWGGYEFAVYSSDRLYAEIVSYQGKSFALHVQRAESDRAAYDDKVWNGGARNFATYEDARRAMLAAIIA